MKTDLFDYDLPSELIAQAPVPERPHSRLMTLDRATSAIRHARFLDLPEWLRPGDLLVLNDTRVVPARLLARRTSGAQIEGLFLREQALGRWEVLLRGRGRIKAGEPLTLLPPSTAHRTAGPTEQRTNGVTDPAPRLKLLAAAGQGRWDVAVEPPQPAYRVLESWGRTPLPPYIRRGREAGEGPLGERYQTVYARRPGALAAPTAGLHFTQDLLDQLTQRGVLTTHVTLHVGPGTFRPIRTDDVEQHVLEAERFEVSALSADAITSAAAESRRVIAVGTTSLRVLETLAHRPGGIAACTGWTDLFIAPPFTFRLTGALITNFHLPRSSLLVLVSAFAGRERILAAYAEAIRLRYRFYSFGDAMLIL